MGRRLVVFFAVLVPLPAAAQNDQEAGLFAPARQLPLVAQSERVRIGGGEAEIELLQVFANEHDEVAQADYRLHLPNGATVSGFGFWRGSRYLEAEIKEKEEAGRAHAAAASAGRATGLLQREGTMHSFSVFPIAARSLQQVKTTIRMPVVMERGRSHLRLPLDSFLGHASLESTVWVDLDAEGPLVAVGVDGVPFKTLARDGARAAITFAAERSAEIWWAVEAPPLLVGAEAVPLDDGSLGIQLRVVFNDAADLGPRPRAVGLLLDTSYSMRRRGPAIADAVARVVEQATMPVRLYGFAAEVVAPPDGEPSEQLQALLSGRPGFSSSWAKLREAAVAAGCGAPGLRCLAITDPQIDGLDLSRSDGFETLFLADADELAYFANELGDSALTHRPGDEARARLHAAVDELVLPILEVESAVQPGGSLELLGRPRLRVAEGGILRLFARSLHDGPIELALRSGGRTLTRLVDLEHPHPDSAQGRAIRRGVCRETLDAWMAEYRRSRDPELRARIVALSLKEQIPTELTALHVADDIEPGSGLLPRTATPAAALRLAGGILMLLAGLLHAWRRRA